MKKVVLLLTSSLCFAAQKSPSMPPTKFAGRTSIVIDALCTTEAYAAVMDGDAMRMFRNFQYMFDGNRRDVLDFMFKTMSTEAFTHNKLATHCLKLTLHGLFHRMGCYPVILLQESSAAKAWQQLID